MPDTYIIKKETMMSAYPRYKETPDLYENRVESVKEGFVKTYGEPQELRIFSAPGRTEIGGNHTDHQQGCVLAAAIDLDILAGAAKNGTSKVRILSEGYPMEEVDIADLTIKQEEINTSKSLVRGIAARLKEKGFDIGGFDLYGVSSVLKGSGLSSSAAFEVLIGVIMNNLYCNGKVSAVEIAQIGQYAENVYFGKPCGLMDQMASSVGNVVAIDFKDTNHPIVEKVDFDFGKTGYSLCIIDSGADHADLTNDYAAIPGEMKAVAKFFGKEVLREVDKNQFFDSLQEVRKITGDRAVLRAMHFFNDTERAVTEAEMLKNKDFEGFLDTVKKSGFSSFMYLQDVSVCGRVKNQEVAYALMACHTILQDKGAFRVHGGGFAGTVQAFVPNEMLADFKNKIEQMIFKGCCHVLSIRPVGGVELTEKV